jgi:predicted dehydrogenase
MTIHIGLIGGGNISQTHARAVKTIVGAEVAAVFGTNQKKVAQLCSEFGGKPYEKLESFLRHRPMDMVAIVSPSGLHAAHGISAAEHGLHVLVEKPLDINTERADAVIAAAEAAGVKLGVMFQDRLKPSIQQLRKWLASGGLGKIFFIDAQVKWYRPAEYYSGSKWRGTLALDGGGALINQAVHTVDLLLWLFGDVVRVQARTATLLHQIEAEDTAVAIVEFASGALGVLHATTAAYPGYPRRLEITGSEGTVIVEHDRVVAAQLRREQGEESARQKLSVEIQPDNNQSASSAVVSDFRGHQALFENFLRAIKENSTPVCDGHEGRRSVALVEAIYCAARHPGSSVELPA